MCIYYALVPTCLAHDQLELPLNPWTPEPLNSVSSDLLKILFSHVLQDPEKSFVGTLNAGFMTSRLISASFVCWLWSDGWDSSKLKKDEKGTYILRMLQDNTYINRPKSISKSKSNHGEPLLLPFSSCIPFYHLIPIPTNHVVCVAQLAQKLLIFLAFLYFWAPSLLPFATSYTPRHIKRCKNRK